MNKILQFGLFVLWVSVLSAANASSDLKVTNPSLNSTSVQAGNSISFDFTLNNIGFTASASSYTGIYISTDSIFDANDVYITSRFNSGLSSSGSEIILKQILTIPQSISTGKQYILLYADYDKDVSESNELNNVIGFPINVLPGIDRDLSVDASISTISVEAGNGVSISINLNSNEAGAVGPNNTGLYLSSNSSFDPSDIIISYDQYVYGINGNTTLPLGVAGIIPENTPPGTYYLLIVADNKKQVLETDETNNTDVISLTVTAPSGNRDLFVTNLTVASSIEIGAYFSVGHKINNAGTSSVGRTYTGFYLSTDNVFDPSSDYFITNDCIVPVAGNSFVNENPTLKISSSKPAGNYYLIVFTDFDNEITETNESNNTAIIPITLVNPTADLTIFNPSISASTIEVFNQVTVSYTVKNIGIGSIINNFTSVSISSDAVIDYQDTYLIVAYNGVSIAQTDYTFSYTVTIPSDVLPGTYNLIFKTDYNNANVETDENNNIVIIPITIAPHSNSSDLSFSNTYVLNSPIEAGGVLSFNYRLNNNGISAVTNNTTTSFYLSNDNTKNAGDILVGQTYEPYISGGSYQDGSWFSKIPSNISAGNYYLIFYTDDSLIIPETNENNNSAAVPITITAPADRDLTIQNPSLSVSTIEASYGLTLNATVANIGSVSTTGVSYTSFYLSLDTDLDDVDIFLGNTMTSSLLGGDTEAISNFEIFIDQQTLAGNYYILFIADGADEIVESNENNNVVSLPITVIANDVDLTVSSIILSNNNPTVGDDIYVNFTVNNSGSSLCLGSSADIYLSTDAIWDQNDILANDFLSFPDILPGSSYDYIGANIFIPYSFISGTYYLIIRADNYGYVYETNENNNSNYVPVNVVGVPVPDLIVQHSTISSSTVESGSFVNVNFYVKNDGNQIAYSSYASIFLSEDSNIDNLDTEVASYISVDELNAGDSVYVEVQVEIPIGLDEKTYQLIIKADNLEFIQEGKEQNNTNTIAINIITTGTKDLWIDSVAVSPEVAEAGGVNYLNFRLNNSGTASTAFENFKVYFSDNTTLEGTDDLLYGDAFFVIPAGGFALGDALQLNIPAAAILGQHYILIVADCDNNESESDETNNMQAFPITIVPNGSLDLRISNAGLTNTTVISGGTTSLTYTLKNVAPGPIYNSITGIYFSTDNTIDGSDSLLSTISYSTPLYGGEAINEVGYVISIPTGVPDGNYYLILNCDNDNSITEISETNNTFVLPITIGNPLAIEDKVGVNSSIGLYPNPTRGQVYFDLKGIDIVKDQKLYIINGVGAKVIEKTIYSSQFSLDLSSLEQGIYTYSISGVSNYGKLILIK